jgi:hypothetical protein
MRSVDLIYYMRSRGEISDFQVGKGEGMNSTRNSYHPRDLMEKDQKCIMIIGGIAIFLPHSPVEARACVVDVAAEERRLGVIVIEEKEQTSESTKAVVEEEDHYEEWLKIFNHEVEQKITATLELAVEEEACSIDFIDLCE